MFLLVSLNKKGFTLVEVLCSLGVFSIIFICMMSFDVSSLKMKKDIKTMNNNVLIMGALKNNIIYSLTFEELEQLKTEKKFYINSENMTFDKIKIPLMDVFTDKAYNNSPYMELRFSVPELKVYKLNLSLYCYKPSKTLELQCNFYKGDHK